MSPKFIRTTLVATFAICTNVYAYDIDTCKVQVAVAAPPIRPNENVAFNVTNDKGITKSITVKGGSAPQFIEKLPCGSSPFTISATYYSTNDLLRQLTTPIGRCVLYAGPVTLDGPENSVSVVFPFDFQCDTHQ